MRASAALPSKALSATGLLQHFLTCAASRSCCTIATSRLAQTRAREAIVMLSLSPALCGAAVATLAACVFVAHHARHSEADGGDADRFAGYDTRHAPAADTLYPLFGSSALLHDAGAESLDSHHAGALQHMLEEMRQCQAEYPRVAYSDAANYTSCEGAVLWEWAGYWQYRSRTAYHQYGQPDIDALAARAQAVITKTLQGPRSPVGHPDSSGCQLHLRDIRFFLCVSGADDAAIARTWTSPALCPHLPVSCPPYIVAGIRRVR